MKLSSYLFLVLVLITSACSKNDENDDSSNTNTGGTTTITIDSPWQYSAKVDGTAFGLAEGATVIGSYSGGGSIATPPDSSLAFYGSALMDSSFTFSYFDIHRNGHYFLGYPAENADFRNFFYIGSYPYTELNTNGIYVHWRDESGTTWGSDYGSADQTGSNFVIDQIKEINGQIDYTLKVLAHFNCKLYDGNGNSKTLTEGKFVGQFANY